MSSEHDDAVRDAFDALGQETTERLIAATQILAEHTAPAPAPGQEPAAQPGPFSPVTDPKVFWWATGTPADIRTAMGHLAYFVEWLLAVYDLPRRQVPSCWIHHPDVVQELWALMCLHHVTHQANQHSGPIAFASNLAQAKNRLTELAAGSRCTDRHHPVITSPADTDARRDSYDGDPAEFAWTWPPQPIDDQEQR